MQTTIIESFPCYSPINMSQKVKKGFISIANVACIINYQILLCDSQAGSPAMAPGPTITYPVRKNVSTFYRVLPHNSKFRTSNATWNSIQGCYMYTTLVLSPLPPSCPLLKLKVPWRDPLISLYITWIRMWLGQAACIAPCVIVYQTYSMQPEYQHMCVD